MRSSLGLLRRAALLACVAAGLAAATAGAHQRGVIGHLYINDNTAGANTIAAFNRHADGTLTPVPGSPFRTGGAGTGAVIGSQGALQTAGDGRYLLAVNAGSNQISVLGIRANGSLTRVSGGLEPSGGVQPVSIAVNGGLVYVANAGPADADYTGFRLTRGGELHRIPGSTFSLPANAQPGDVLFNGDGANLVGIRIGSSLIDSFSVGGDGRLTAAPGSPFAAQGPGPFGSEFRPTNPAQLFVSNAHGGPDKGTVSAFSVSDAGALSSIGSSPFADHQNAPCWVEITHDGRFLFTVNTGSSSVSRYAIAQDGSLTLLGSTRLRGPSSLAPEDARLAPDGKTLWVVDSGGRAVSGFKVSGGDLTELRSSPTALPADAAPFGIVVN